MVDFLNDNKVDINWFSSEKLMELLEQDKIKIKHERVGFGETILLTASSEELQEFIKKYLNSNDADKWATDVEFNLNRINEK